MSVAAPPVRPVAPLKTGRGGRPYYTIHSKPNDVFSLKLDENVSTAIVGFKKWDDAFFIGQMIETHFERQHELPDTRLVGQLVLPGYSNSHDLNYIFIRKWAFEDLKMTCTSNFLNLISVDDIIKKKATSGYTFAGNVYSFEAPLEFYKDRLNDLYMIN